MTDTPNTISSRLAGVLACLLLCGCSDDLWPKREKDSKSPVAERRTWTRAGTEQTLQARFVSIRDNVVVLERSDGTLARTSLAKLSPIDRAYVASRQKMAAKAQEEAKRMKGGKCLLEFEPPTAAPALREERVRPTRETPLGDRLGRIDARVEGSTGSSGSRLGSINPKIEASGRTGQTSDTQQQPKPAPARTLFANPSPFPAGTDLSGTLSQLPGSGRLGVLLEDLTEAPTVLVKINGRDVWLHHGRERKRAFSPPITLTDEEGNNNSLQIDIRIRGERDGSCGIGAISIWELVPKE